jgi:hypothetical protein
VFGTSGHADCFDSRGGRGCGLQAAHLGCVPRTSAALRLQGGGSAPSLSWYCGGGSLHLQRQRWLWGGGSSSGSVDQGIGGVLYLHRRLGLWGGRTSTYSVHINVKCFATATKNGRRLGFQAQEKEGKQTQTHCKHVSKLLNCNLNLTL